MIGHAETIQLYIYVWRAVWCLSNGCGIRVAQHFSDFFHKVKPNRKKGFYTSRLPKNEKIGGIFVFSGSELFKLFSKIKNLNLKIKKSKTYSGLTSYLGPVRWYHYHGNLILPDSTFNIGLH
jgi:hypothetical protein